MNKSIETKKYIIDSANELFYINGYNCTGFGAIEEKTGLSRGNITYHFKNKKNIIQEIVNLRLERINKTFHECDKNSKNSKESIVKLCKKILENSNDLLKYGCPMGSIVSESAKNNKNIHKITIVMFEAFINWLEKKFIEMGTNKSQANIKAKRLLAQIQGVIMVAHTLDDSYFLKKEFKRLIKEFSIVE